MAYTVTQRTHELGLRMALGAETCDVIKLVLQEAMTLASIGVAAGIAAALMVTRVLSTLLFGVRPTEPAILVAVSSLVVGVALLAGYMPARQATTVDPMVALRCE